MVSADNNVLLPSGQSVVLEATVTNKNGYFRVTMYEEEMTYR
jgi:hypothetical protein